MIVSKYGFSDIQNYDASVAAQIVSGIGFLGAGIIFIRNRAVAALRRRRYLGLAGWERRWVPAYYIGIAVTVLIVLRSSFCTGSL
ncbi:MAG: hypothetical protein ACLUOI_29660 [Eisenbergiella sp.]